MTPPAPSPPPVPFALPVRAEVVGECDIRFFDEHGNRISAVDAWITIARAYCPSAQATERDKS